MPVTVTAEPIDKDIAVLINETLSPQAQSKALAGFARESLVEAKAQNAQAYDGEVPPYDTIVDGAKGGNEDSVRPNGTIEYVFRLVTDVLTWIDQELIAHSPVKSGRYDRSHKLFADGVEADPDAPPVANEYVFLNIQPYARKIERGESLSYPEGVYEGVALRASSQFGDIAKIDFEYRAAPSGSAASDQSARHSHRRVAHQEWLTRQPAIVIKAL